MLYQLRRAVLATSLMLTISVSSAAADCAWVLWEFTRRAGDKREWRVLSAMSSRRDCEVDGRTRANRDLYIETDEEGEWEVVGPPSTASGGKAVQALVRRFGDPTSERPVIWPAHEKLTIRRAG